jgi:GT2 family glycosyltransferase
MSEKESPAVERLTPGCDLQEQYCLLSVVVPNWNGRRFLDTCLTSLENQTNKNFEIIIADNGSTDGSVEYLASSFPKVRMVISNKNAGFANAVNAGTLAAKSDLVFLLNNDTEVDRNCIQEILDAVERYPDDSFFSCKMMNFGFRDILDGTGDCVPRTLNPFKRGERWKDSDEFKLSQRTFGACAGAAVYKKKALTEVNMFDEDFFAYYEDVDVSMRLQLAGYTCRYLPKAVVFHMGSATTGSSFNPFIARYLARNKCFLLVKNLSWGLLWANWPWLVWGEVGRFRLFVKQGCVREYLKGVVEALIKLPKMIRKRKQILGSAKVSNKYIQKMMEESEQWLQPEKMAPIPPK